MHSIYILIITLLLIIIIYTLLSKNNYRDYAIYIGDYRYPSIFDALPIIESYASTIKELELKNVIKWDSSSRKYVLCYSIKEINN